MRLRDDYTQDCARACALEQGDLDVGFDFQLKLPHVAFHRHIGEFRDIHATPEGVLIDDATWNATQERRPALDRQTANSSPA